MLEAEGFKEVFNMEGGLKAWNGFMAEGPPESGFAYFSDATTPAQFIGLAWTLEEGSRRFYFEVSGFIEDKESGDLFRNLTKSEEHHKEALIKLYEDFFGSPPAEGFPREILSVADSGNFMEGGMQVNDALKWARRKDAVAILELSISLETNAYDLYIRMERKMSDDKSRSVFRDLAHEEKKHLEKLAGVLEKKV